MMTFEDFISKYKVKLTGEQLCAVKSISNPTLLLAVPGSGKTTVLVARIAYMIYCCGISPESILTLTYTVAATRDMKARFEDKYDPQKEKKIVFRTINGICASIIAFYSKKINKEAFKLLADEAAKIHVLRDIYLEVEGSYPADSDLVSLATYISYIKNMMLDEEEIRALEEEADLSLLSIYKRYLAYLRENSLMDYDDQLIYALRILRQSKDTLEYYQEKYKYICVDEAQDTSKIQHCIIGLLASKYKNIFMVGDEDQSIYGFRAAYPKALLDFENTYKDANILYLSKNFRSAAKIVEVANEFINKNTLRHKKNMTPAREKLGNIRSVQIKNRNSQYNYLFRVAESKIADNTKNESKLAILYRDNESMVPIIDLFEKNNIDYAIRQIELGFFSNRIVMDIKNIIRFANNMNDTDLFMQIYYKINLYINKQLAISACNIAKKDNISPIDAMEYLIDDYRKINIKAIAGQFNAIKNEAGKKALFRIRTVLAYDKYLERMNIKDDKLEILKMIASDEGKAFDLIDRLDFLENRLKSKENTGQEKVVLSTIHSSKGLEYDEVYIIDAIDGIFPEQVVKNALDERYKSKKGKKALENYEENRRLFYVAMTRAKEKLCVFRYENSVFPDELAEYLGENVDIRQNSKAEQDSKYKYGSLLKSKEDKKPNIEGMYRENKSFTRYSSKMDENSKEFREEYKNWSKRLLAKKEINHKKYGKGSVISLENDILLVEFTGHSAKCKLSYLIKNQLIY